MATDIVGHAEQKGVFIFGCLLSIAALTVLSILFTRRMTNFNIRTCTVTRWLVLGVYIDSYIFVVTSTTLRLGVGLNNGPVCQVTILLCLLTYMSTKIIIYFFLVERVHIVRSNLPRKKDKLYLFNTFGVMIPFGVIVTMSFVYRIGKLDKQEHCKIGMGLAANIPLILFDSGVNIYLTSLFLTPLLGLYSFRQGSPRLRRVAKRTFIGSLLTLSTSIANLIALATQVKHGGEYAWVCHMTCTADIIFAAGVLHWITSPDLEGKATGQPAAAPPAMNPDQCPVCKNHRPVFSFSRYRARRRDTSKLSTLMRTEKTVLPTISGDDTVKGSTISSAEENRVETPTSPIVEYAPAPAVTRSSVLIASTRDLESAMTTLQEYPDKE